jgi:hypothetical protein
MSLYCEIDFGFEFEFDFGSCCGRVHQILNDSLASEHVLLPAHPALIGRLALDRIGLDGIG